MLADLHTLPCNDSVSFISLGLEEKGKRFHKIRLHDLSNNSLRMGTNFNRIITIWDQIHDWDERVFNMTFLTNQLIHHEKIFACVFYEYFYGK